MSTVLLLHHALTHLSAVAPSATPTAVPTVAATAAATAAATSAATSSTTTTTSTGLNLPALILTIIIWVPALVAAMVLLFPTRTRDDVIRVKTLGLVASSISVFVLAITLLPQIGLGTSAGFLGTQTSSATSAVSCQPNTSGEAAYCELRNWITGFPLQGLYHLDADGITLVLLTLSCVLFAAAMLSLFRRHDDGIRRMIVLTLLLETGVNGVLCSQDYLLLMCFLAATAVPLFLMLNSDERASLATAPRIAGLVIGPWLLGVVAFMLSAITVVVHSGVVLAQLGQSQVPTFDYTANGHLPAQTAASAAQIASAHLLEDAGFAIMVGAALLLMGAAPAHRWLIRATAEADTAVAALLLGIVSRLGAYLLIRDALSAFTDVAPSYLIVISALGVVSAVWGAVGAIGESDIRRLLGYAGLTQSGVVLLAIGAATPISLLGAVLMIVAGGLALGMLVFIAGAIEERARTRQMSALGGLAQRAPRLAGLWVVGVMSLIGVPLLATFPALINLLLGSYPSHRLMTAVVMVALLATDVALVRSVVRVFYGVLPEAQARFTDASTLDNMVIGTPLGLILLYGLLPNEMMVMVNNAVEQITQGLVR